MWPESLSVVSIVRGWMHGVVRNAELESDTANSRAVNNRTQPNHGSSPDVCILLFMSIRPLFFQPCIVRASVCSSADCGIVAGEVAVRLVASASTVDRKSSCCRLGWWLPTAAVRVITDQSVSNQTMSLVRTWVDVCVCRGGGGAVGGEGANGTGSAHLLLPLRVYRAERRAHARNWTSTRTGWQTGS